MYEKTKKELVRLGLNANGNNFYGALYGYETNASINLYGLIFKVSMFRTPDQQREIEQQLLPVKSRFINWQWTYYGIALSITDWTQKSMLKKLESLLQTIYGIFAQNSALGVGYCPICGKELDFENTKKCLIDGATVSIENDCVEKINIAITEQNKEFDATPNNYLRGFLGALIGGVAGAVVAIVLYLVGFISALSAFVAFLVGIILYKKFGGKPNKMMLVIVTVTTFVFMILSVLCIYIVASGIEARNAGLEISAIEAFKIVMKDDEVSRLFWVDMAMTVLFTILGCVWEIIRNAKKIKRQKNI